MPPKLLLFSVGIYLSTMGHVLAQTNSICGKVKASNEKNLTGATIYLYNFADSTLTKTSFTDTAGNFILFQVKKGNYFVVASHINYQNNRFQVINFSGENKFTCPPIVLQLEEKKLQAITIASSYQKPIIIVTADKTIFNVENSINSIGSNAFELLQKSPGVVTDKDDNISMMGKNGVRIYIDGRPTPMEGTELSSYLKSINSASISSIEMISNPSAKYDAAGNAGIINIKFKKNNTLGLTAAISSGLNFGRTLKTTESFSLNYRSTKFNLFSNYSFNQGKNYNTFDLYRIQNDSLYNQKSTQVIKENVQNVKVGVDFFTSKKSTVGIIYTGDFTDNTTYSNSRTPSSSIKTGSIERILYASNLIPALIKNQNLNLNYHFEDSTGHEINVDLDHGFYKNHKTSYQPNSYFTPSPETLLSEENYRNNTPIDITINTAKFDYTTPLKKGKFSAGAKFSHIITDNTFALYDITSGQNVLDQNASNNFVYKENINAAYISYFTPLNKTVKLQAGLRLENTVSNSLLTSFNPQQRTGDEMIHRNYTDLFPNLSLNFTINADNNLNASYSRRIDRPNYNDLNPFETRVDELTYIKGNAYLQPQYTNIFQVSHTLKNLFVTTLSYSHVNNFSTFIIDSAKVSQTFITKKNLASQDISSINFSAPVDFTKWWNLYSSLTAYNSSYRANFGKGKILKINISAFSLNAINTFKLGKEFSAELTGFYSSPSIVGGTFKTKGTGTVDLGFQKKFWNDRASIKITGTDIFGTLKFKGSSNFGGVYLVANSVWESRQCRINFNYRFAGTQIKQARDRNSGNEEEKLRTAGSSGFGN